MYRKMLEKLIDWKNKGNRKPLILEGARQVGKTWLMKEFGKQCYKNTVYINFDENNQVHNLFSGTLTVSQIITGLEIFSNQKIVKDDTLIIFDEIQEEPRALACLKYFCENNPEYHVVCAGSLLGIALHEGTSFPVGKVEFLPVYPLIFSEFLLATGRAKLAELLNQNQQEIINAMQEEYIGALREYYFVGGMPEAVASFAEQKDYGEVRNIQKRLLLAYEQDFSKHAPTGIVPKIRMVWNSIVGQLAKEHRKFVYGLIREGARAKDYETSIMWLGDCGLVHRVNRVASGSIPLKAYEDLKAFKLYFLDVGLLGCMAGVSPRALLSGGDIFREFKGALTEQYVLQELKATGDFGVYYYTNDRNSCEVDFVLDTGSAVVPLEVKAEINLQAKSLKVFMEKFAIPLGVRCSMAGYIQQANLLNLPLYQIDNMFLKLVYCEN